MPTTLKFLSLLQTSLFGALCLWIQLSTRYLGYLRLKASKMEHLLLLHQPPLSAFPDVIKERFTLLPEAHDRNLRHHWHLPHFSTTKSCGSYFQKSNSFSSFHLYHCHPAKPPVSLARATTTAFSGWLPTSNPSCSQ